MKEKNEEEQIKYTIRVNKKLINKKNNFNINNIITPKKINKSDQKINDKISRNIFYNKDINNNYMSDYDSNHKSPNENYSQKTYTCKYYSKDNSYKKGNVFYDMQINKYLKPILCSKDIQNKIMKCQIMEPIINVFSFNNDANTHTHTKCLSEMPSPQQTQTNNTISYFKEKFNINDHNTLDIKNENSRYNNIYSILKKIKNQNSNCQYYFSRNDLNNNKECFSSYNKNGVNINNYNINSFKLYEKKNKTYKKLFNQLINNEKNEDDEVNSFNFRNNLVKYNSHSYGKNNRKTLNEKLSYFCNILERLFLNIIKKMYLRLINQLIKIKNKSIENNIYKINSEEANTRRNTLYDSDTVKSHKNSIFDNEVGLKSNTISNNNYINFGYYNTNRFDRDIIEKSKEKKHKKMCNNTFQKNLDNSLKRYESIDNDNYNYQRIKHKYFIIKRKEMGNSNNSLIYHKKVNYSRNIDNSVKKDKNENLNVINQKNNTNYINNSIEKEKNHTIEAKIQKIQKRIIIIRNKKKSIKDKLKYKKVNTCFNYYTIEDINYEKKYINKYKYEKKQINGGMHIFKNINFSIIQNNKTLLYKKIKISHGIDHKRNNTLLYESNKNLNKRKKIYNININSTYRKDKPNINYIYYHSSINRSNSNNSNNKKESKLDNNCFDGNTRINKIIINCVKFLSKIIRKLLIKKYFNLLTKKLNI